MDKGNRANGWAGKKNEIDQGNSRKRGWGRFNSCAAGTQAGGSLQVEGDVDKDISNREKAKLVKRAVSRKKSLKKKGYERGQIPWRSRDSAGGGAFKQESIKGAASAEKEKEGLG